MCNITILRKIALNEISRNLQKDKEWNNNYVKNGYKNRKMAKKASNKYSLSIVNVL